MKLIQLVTEYIGFKKSIGMRFRTDAGILKAWSWAMGDIDIREVAPSSVLAFIAGKGSVTASWHLKFRVLTSFYRFAMGRDYVISSPLPKIIPKCPEPMTPYIYTSEELRRLVEATDMLKTSMSPLQKATFRTLLLLLYSTGLRISEALSLTLAKVNLSESLIAVRDTKFFKSRLVPIGIKLTAELCSYVKKRRQLPRPAGESSGFFATRTGNPLAYRRVNKIFQILRKRAGIRREDRAPYQPRIHDIRHTFVVHRLLAWYRQGIDVQRMLPQLSTYLGHVDIAQTQRYLSMTPELLNEARCRFEQYALTEMKDA